MSKKLTAARRARFEARALMQMQAQMQMQMQKRVEGARVC
jgi:hypothetical protein